MDSALIFRSMEKKLYVIAASMTKGLSFMTAIGDLASWINSVVRQVFKITWAGWILALYVQYPSQSISLSLELWGLLVSDHISACKIAGWCVQDSAFRRHCCKLNNLQHERGKEIAFFPIQYGCYSCTVFVLHWDVAGLRSVLIYSWTDSGLI